MIGFIVKMNNVKYRIYLTKKFKIHDRGYTVTYLT